VIRKAKEDLADQDTTASRTAGAAKGRLRQ
jgi:hypothetical protein